MPDIIIQMLILMILSCSDTDFEHILQGQFLSALDSLLQFAEDLLVDIPKFWDFLAQVCKFLAILLIKDFLYSCIHSKVVAPTLAPSGPLPLAVVKESAVQVIFLRYCCC